MYDFVKPESGYERFADGLSGDVVEEISRKKDEPDWMLQMRLKALETYERMEMPKNWGPAIGRPGHEHDLHVRGERRQAGRELGRRAR